LKTLIAKKQNEELGDEKTLAKIVVKKDVETIFKTFKVVHGMLVRT